MSLRARLVAAVVALLATGLVVVALATVGALRLSVIARTDTELNQVSSILAAPLSVAMRASRPPAAGGANRAPASTGQPLMLLQVLNPDGSTLANLSPADTRSLPIGVRPEEPSPANPDGAVRQTLSIDGARPEDWRVRVSWLPDKQAIFVIGLPMAELQTSTDRLIVIEIIATVVVLAAMALIALRVIRVGLRPLDGIAEVASAIGAGQLDRRVRPGKPDSEIGRLGGALNAMLVQIQTAFHERRASEERLRRFVADASHELNTPIATIRGYAELFRHGAAERPDDLAMAMRRIESEATRMGQLVNELLTLVKLDEGRPLEREPVDLTHLATEAVADSRAIEPDRPLSVESGGAVGVGADGHVVVSGDDARLRQLMANLLSNVRRHTPAGTAAVVRVRAVDGTAVIEVADEGPGMTAEDCERVFERFYRTATTRSRQRSGSGLGLAIVASIAAAHGGTAEVFSEPGRGTTFTIRLPRAGPVAFSE